MKATKADLENDTEERRKKKELEGLALKREDVWDESFGQDFCGEGELESGSRQTIPNEKETGQGSGAGGETSRKARGADSEARMTGGDTD